MRGMTAGAIGLALAATLTACGGGRETPSVTPTIVSPCANCRSDGFLPGSVYKNREDTPSSRGPGVRLSVPIN